MAPALLDSPLPDLRDIPLDAIGDMPAAELEDLLKRLVPAPLAGQVPVAAFTSSI